MVFHNNTTYQVKSALYYFYTINLFDNMIAIHSSIEVLGEA